MPPPVDQSLRKYDGTNTTLITTLVGCWTQHGEEPGSHSGLETLRLRQPGGLCSEIYKRTQLNHVVRRIDGLWCSSDTTPGLPRVVQEDRWTVVTALHTMKPGLPYFESGTGIVWALYLVSLSYREFVCSEIPAYLIWRFVGSLVKYELQHALVLKGLAGVGWNDSQHPIGMGYGG